MTTAPKDSDCKLDTDAVGIGSTALFGKFRRVWAMPSADTFSVPPMGDMVKRYLRNSKVSIDPFARNKRWATYTNDLNPETAAEYHMDAEDFLRKHRQIAPDLVIFDPPYSPGQVAEVYSSVGEKRDGGGGRNGELYARVRRAIREMSVPGTIVLSFGWQSAGMGPGWETLEIMLVCHGGAHNDTICLAERMTHKQGDLFDLPNSVDMATTDEGRCPKCGCQVRDPFGGSRVIHDVRTCRGAKDPNDSKHANGSCAPPIDSAEEWTVRAEDYDALAGAARNLADACKKKLPPGSFAEVAEECSAVRALLYPPPPEKS